MALYGIFDKDDNLSRTFEAPSYESACTELSFYKGWSYGGDTLTCNINPMGFCIRELTNAEAIKKNSNPEAEGSNQDEEESILNAPCGLSIAQLMTLIDDIVLRNISFDDSGVHENQILDIINRYQFV